MAEKETSFLNRLRMALGIYEEPKKKERPLTPSEQKAIDRAVPRRFENTNKPKPKPKPKPRASVSLSSLSGNEDIDDLVYRGEKSEPVHPVYRGEKSVPQYLKGK